MDLPQPTAYPHPVRNPIIVALDVPEAGRAVDLASRLAPHVGAVKVGKELFTAAGPDIVRRLRATGTRVFLDLKFHDIPNTVAGAVRAAVGLDVQMLTLHASGGLAMLQAAQQAAVETANRLGLEPPLLLGVTVLTSLNDAALAEVGIPGPLAAQVERLARLSVAAGLPGLVCSPHELPVLRRLVPDPVQLVTPGIRPPAAEPDDQRRVMTPAEAIAAGANWLVIGRPITAAADPVSAAVAIHRQIVPSGI